MCLLPGCRVTGSEETVPAICSGCGSGVLHRGCFERLEQQCLREVTKNPKFESSRVGGMAPRAAKKVLETMWDEDYGIVKKLCNCTCGAGFMRPVRSTGTFSTPGAFGKLGAGIDTSPSKEAEAARARREAKAEAAFGRREFRRRRTKGMDGSLRSLVKWGLARS